MSTTKTVLGIVPGIMALGVVGKSAKMAKDSFSKKGKKVPLLKDSMKLMVSIPLIGVTAGMINSI